MSSPDNKFIESLSQELKPGRHMRPSMRALSWGLTFTAINIVGMLVYKPFRPQFFNQILEHGRFATEIITATAFSCLLIYLVFTAMVPGKKIKNTILALTSLSFIVLIYALLESFSHASPSRSPVGARPFCVEEVALYGLLGMVVFSYFSRKSFIGFSRLQYFTMGVAAGLVPGVLMQLACMYSPKHALILHYGPSLILGAIACIVLPFFKRT